MRLTVVIPCFNAGPHLPTLLRSLQSNLDPGFEFLLVEDGSTDDTRDVLEKLVPTVRGARLITHDANLGLSAARNRGVSEAQGTYLMFLDADDWLAPEHLKDIVRTIERLGCDFVRTDHVSVQGRRRALIRSPETRRNRVLSPRSAIVPPYRSTSVDYSFAWAGIYHRRLADRGVLSFAEQLRSAEDRPWIWRLHREADSFATVGQLGVFHRRGLPTSLTESTDATQLHFLGAMHLMLAETMADADRDFLLPKAVDSFCALINFQIAKRERLSPELQADLLRGCAAALESMPQDVLAQVLTEGPPRRRTLLTRLRRRAGAISAVA